MDPVISGTPECFYLMVRDELVKNAKAVYIVFDGNPSKSTIFTERDLPTGQNVA